MNRGLLAAFGAFLCWGVFPIYWKALDHVPALEIVAHRLVWCCLWVVLFLFVTRGARWLTRLLRRPRVLRNLTVSSALIGANWFLYIWAVNAGHIVETSLGYFINPLVNVMFGVLLFSERLNRRQWLAIGVAAAGVAYMTLAHGRLPWIALVLAASFGLYSVMRKITDVESMPGLAWESAVYFPVACAGLLWLAWSGDGAMGRVDWQTDGLLLLSGVLTAVPLILFAIAARQVPLSTIGVMQYLAPTLQLLCGTLLYDEPFTPVEAVGFGCIWTALAIYTADGLGAHWRRRALARARPVDALAAEPADAPTSGRSLQGRDVS
ncbi:EamA family transporter RarD [Abyssibacter profundi]|uniref:EamA family transporter RarD n=1 Tax=Abyssibacter profundi TaxID=2182787 RepID=A0A363UKL5_9GAMM|nr:EamA family transporter RarD [Abyssibacter profundi]MBV62486.1 protein RarD [Nevskiales bacterium]PWN55954.1 EamA family transporter RarD [Abyssibacter profundi]